MTVATIRNELSGGDPVVRLGRVALATQGILYVIVGLLAVQVSGGDDNAKPSQKGALENVAHQPFGRILLNRGRGPGCALCLAPDAGHPR